MAGRGSPDDPFVLRQRSREGTWAKIIRAEEHLAAIHAEVALYAEGEPYHIVGEFDAEGAEYTARLRLHEVPPVRLQLLIGDFAHNLRSALDHLAAWLVTRTGRVPTSDTAFPIRLSQTDRRGNVRPTQVKPGISVEAMAVIESLQPYTRGAQAPWDKLAVLSAINNTDKHRNLFVTTATISHAIVWLEMGGLPIVPAQVVRGRFEHGADLAVFTLDVPVPVARQHHVKVQAQGVPLVTFAEPEPIGDKTVETLLGDLLEYVRLTVIRPVEMAELTRRTR